MLPSVSVPRVTAVKPIEAAIPEPEEEPQGSACGKYALLAGDNYQHRMMVFPA
jgi:hypothetical protein